MTKITKEMLEISAKVALDLAVRATDRVQCKRWVNTPEGGRWWVDSCGMHAALGDEMSRILGTEIKILVINEWRVAVFCGKLQVEVPNTNLLRALVREVEENK